MAQTVPRQHPAVVLRSHYTHLRALLAIAMIAIAGLTIAVVVLATNDDGSATSVSTPAGVTPSVRPDGGPEESNVAAAVGSRPAAGPSESSTAAAIGKGSTPSTGGPDESRTAAAISGN